MRVLAIIEAITVTGPAKNLIRFASLANRRPKEGPAIEISICTFIRRPQPAENQFIQRARSSGIGVNIVSEDFAFDPRVAGQLRTLVKQHRPDIVQTHGVKSHFLARAAGLDRLSRWIAFHHGYTSVDAKMLVYNRLDRWSLRSARRVITVCQPFVDELLRNGVVRSGIEVLPNSIEPMSAISQETIEQVRRQYKIRPGERVILSIGRLSQEKGHIQLVAAATELARLRQDLDLRFLIAGDGIERKRLEQAAAASPGHFLFLGHIADVRPLFGIADVFALPSYSEGSPNVLLEAMAAGVPVVASNVGGVLETVEHGSSALLVPPGDAAALGASILRILENPALANGLRENALRAVENRSPEAHYRALAAIYHSVCEESVTAM